MSLKDTVDRLRRARERPEDADEIVLGWRLAVATLYDQVEAWLSPYVADGGMVLTRHTKPAHEERTGDYEVDVLDIEVGPETVRMEPRGAIVIGARGRVDVTLLGRGEPVILILDGAGTTEGWAIVDRSSRSRLTPLSAESFEATLDALLGGLGIDPGFSM